MSGRFFFALILFFVSGVMAVKAAPLRVSNQDVRISAMGHGEIVPADQPSAGIQEVIEKKLNWQVLKSPSPGIQDNTVWLRLHLENPENRPWSGVILLDHTFYTNVDFYFPEGTGPIQSSSVAGTNMRRVQTGLLHPFSTRAIPHTAYAFPLHLDEGQEATVYFRLRVLRGMRIPLYVMNQSTWLQNLEIETVVKSMYYGIILVMGLYNAFLFFSIRHNSYLYYVIRNLFLLGTILTLNGDLFRIIPNPGFIHQNIPALVFLNAWAGVRFARSFVDIRSYSVTMDRVLVGFEILSLVGAMLTPILDRSLIMILVVRLIAPIMVSVLLLFIIWLWVFKKSRQAGFFGGAYLIFGIGILIQTLGPTLNFDSTSTKFFLMGSSGLEMVILSLGLADRINTLQKNLIVLNDNLEQQVQDRTEKLSLAYEQTNNLLNRILPVPIASELKEKGIVHPVRYEEASILFTDFVGFTRISEEMTPDELIKELDNCFSYFDVVSEKYNLEKIKTIGDSYMMAGGIPAPNSTHALDSVLAALEIQGFMSQMMEIKIAQGLPFWELRLGINTGPLVAGVIAEKRFQYDVWGDTVNTASRLESAGIEGKINIGEKTYQKVKDVFHCEYRGRILAKNKGEIPMYFVLGIKPEFSVDGHGRVPNERFKSFYHSLKESVS